jgi:hypothetical protein
MTGERRLDNYRRQRGTWRLTPRQRRRWTHKRAREIKLWEIAEGLR